jgi:hypothetical protein
MRNRIRNLVERIEGYPVTPAGLAAIFGLTVVARNVIEGASSGTLFPPSAFLLHFPIAYVFPMLGITAMMSVLSSHPPCRMLKLMVFAWTLTLLPPVLDLMLGEQSGIGYFPLDRSNALSFLTRFFDPSTSLPGTTTGIRIEAAVGCLLAGLFVGATSTRLPALRGLLTAVLFFPFFLLFFTWPQLVRMVLEPLFPAADHIQDFLQWHIATPPQLTGSVHNTVFLTDMWPVLALSAWFWPRISRGTWLEAGRALRKSLLPGLVPAAAGCLAACLQAFRLPVTFPDLMTISGAFAAASLAAVAAESTGPATIALGLASLIEATACGWPVAATALGALLAGRLPLAAPLRRAVTSPMLLALAASPVFLPPGSLPLLVLPAAAAALAGLLSRTRLAAIPAMAALALPLLARPDGIEPASRWFLEDVTQSFSRSTRNAHAHVSSSLLAASGGSLLPLAEAAQLEGNLARSAWVCELAASEGDSSAELMRVRLNIALQEDDTVAFWDLMKRFERTGEDLGDIPLAMLRQAAASADTSILLAIHRVAGPSAQFLTAYAEAMIALGDTASAVSFAGGATSRPDAGASEFAFAIEISGVAGNGSWDSLFEEGTSRIGTSLPLMLARIRAPLLAGSAPDRADLVSTCLAISPASPEVLETCAAWMLASGLPDSALALAERSVMAQMRPSLRSFVLACECAASAGRAPRLASLLRYARSEYPTARQLERFEGSPGQPDQGL